MAKGVRDLVVYIERKRLSFYGGIFEKITSLPLDEKLVKDLEVVDKNAFFEAINTSVNVRQASANLVIVFSDSVSFFKDLPGNLTREQLGKEEKSFSLTVPFDETATKLIKVGNGYQIIAINWEFCRVVVEVLVPKGFKLVATIPAIVVPEFDQKTGLTDKVGLTIVSKIDSLKNYSFYQPVLGGEQMKSAGSSPVSSKNKFKLMPILIGVFLVLVSVLVMLILKGK